MKEGGGLVYVSAGGGVWPPHIHQGTRIDIYTDTETQSHQHGAVHRRAPQRRPVVIQ